jgi:hypothetical protein
MLCPSSSKGAGENQAAQTSTSHLHPKKIQIHLSTMPRGAQEHVCQRARQVIRRSFDADAMGCWGLYWHAPVDSRRSRRQRGSHQ